MNMLEGCLFEDKNTTVFSKFIYLITLFVNGKEINDFLTTLIHQFENIESFMTVLRARGLRAACVPEYRLFSKSKQVASELRVINSFSELLLFIDTELNQIIQ